MRQDMEGSSPSSDGGVGVVGVVGKDYNCALAKVLQYEEGRGAFGTCLNVFLAPSLWCRFKADSLVEASSSCVLAILVLDFGFHLLI